MGPWGCQRHFRGSRCQGARVKRRVNIWGCNLGSGHFSSPRFPGRRVARAAPGAQGRPRAAAGTLPAAPPRPAPAGPYKTARPRWPQLPKERVCGARWKLRGGARLREGERQSGSTRAGQRAPERPGLRASVPTAPGPAPRRTPATRAEPSPLMKPPAAQSSPAAAAAAGEWGSRGHPGCPGGGRKKGRAVSSVSTQPLPPFSSVGRGAWRVQLPFPRGLGIRASAEWARPDSAFPPPPGSRAPWGRTRGDQYPTDSAWERVPLHRPAERPLAHTFAKRSSVSLSHAGGLAGGPRPGGWLGG